jgi:hypothetical protein
MSIMLASTDTITVVLAAAPATNQLPVHASWVDQGGSGDNQPTLTTGTTAVVVVPAPASGIERLLSQLSIPNTDTESCTVTVSLVRSSTSYELRKITLLPGYALDYDGHWRVMDPNGNFLCDVTVSGGSITSAQGTAAALAGAWPVKVTDGTDVLGTSSNPLRIDPVGATTQPVSVSNFPATQNINLTELDGAALAGPTAWGTAPASGAQVLNVNANIVSGGGGGGGNVNVTEWNTIALGSPTTYGTAPTGEAVIGVNAYITNLPTTQAISGSVSVSNFPATQAVSGSVSVSNFPATQAINQTQLAGSALGAPSNYGTSPGAISVQGVNAFVTNSVAVTGTFWPSTQPVSVAALPALATGANTIGAVTQAAGPWSFNLTEVGGAALALGQQTSAASIPVVLASNQPAVQVNPNNGAQKSVLASMTSTTAVSFGSVSSQYLNAIVVTYDAVTGGAWGLSVKDGSGNLILEFVLPKATTATSQIVINLTGLCMPFNNGTGTPSVSINSAPTAGTIWATIVYT